MHDDVGVSPDRRREVGVMRQPQAKVPEPALASRFRRACWLRFVRAFGSARSARSWLPPFVTALRRLLRRVPEGIFSVLLTLFLTRRAMVGERYSPAAFSSAPHRLPTSRQTTILRPLPLSKTPRPVPLRRFVFLLTIISLQRRLSHTASTIPKTLFSILLTQHDQPFFHCLFRLHDHHRSRFPLYASPCPLAW